MKLLDLEGMRRIQLEVLDVVMKFCDENNIHCFLDGGTLLGAIRHKGYIPWDDDIDVGMLRSDYDRFMDIFNKKNTRYKFHCIENDPSFIYAFGRVLDTRTILYEPDSRTGRRTALNIDVFPMDSAPDDDKALRKMLILQYVYRNLHAARYLPMFTPPNGNIFRKILAYTIRIPMNLVPISVLPRNYFAQKMLDNAKRYAYEDTKRVGSFLGTHEVVIDREKFEKFTYTEFEGKQYKIPIGYDEWLTKLYGDYMKLPPKKWQITHHYYEAYLKEDGDE